VCDHVAGIRSFEHFVIGLDARLPLFDPRNHRKTFHEAGAAKLAVDNDRQIVCDLLSDHLANRFVLRLAQTLLVESAFAAAGEGVF
jgi:hypothetical protein